MKKKIKGKEQVNAAIPSKSVYDIIGVKQFPYAEKTLEEYKASLGKMDWTTLQRHAIDVANILPNVDKRERLVAKLEDAYLKKYYAFTGHDRQSTPAKTSPEIQKILDRGR